MEEVEIKLLYKNKKEVIRYLKKNGWKRNGKLEVVDLYYGKSDKSMSDLNEFFRLRRRGEDKLLTYKGPSQNKGKITKKEEYNLRLGSAEKMKNILEKTSLILVAKRVSEREFWKREGAEFTFMNYTYPAQLNFIELEAKNENKIKEILEELNDKVERADDDIFQEFDKKEKTQSN